MTAGRDQAPGLAYARVLTDEEAAQTKETPPDLASLICSFCGKSRARVPHLFSGCGVPDPDTGVSVPVYICGECVTLCANALADENPSSR